MPLQILHLIHNLKREGAQTMVVNLAIALDPKAAGATIFPWRDGGPYISRLVHANLNVIKSVAGWAPRLRSILALRRAVRDRSIDVVHAHMSDSAILAAAALMGTGVPFVVTHHSNRLLPKEGWVKHRTRRILLTWALRRAALNIGVTPNVAERLKEEFSLPPDRVLHIANGVNVPPEDAVEAAQESRTGDEARASRPLISTIGRLAQVKRQDIAIEAIRSARERLPNVRLRILGEGPLMQELAGRVERHGLGSLVTLAGATDDVAGTLRETDIFVSTSAYEGLPVALLEAMSWGLPVIATDVPGHRDVIRHGIDGRLVPFDDPNALADEIVRLFDTASERKALGLAARQRASRDFSAARMAEEYCVLYRAVTGKATREERSDQPDHTRSLPGLTPP